VAALALAPELRPAETGDSEGAPRRALTRSPAGIDSPESLAPRLVELVGLVGLVELAGLAPPLAGLLGGKRAELSLLLPPPPPSPLPPPTCDSSAGRDENAVSAESAESAEPPPPGPPTSTKTTGRWSTTPRTQDSCCTWLWRVADNRSW
jgi:hypothetical protein